MVLYAPTHDNLRHGTAMLDFLYLPVRTQATPSDRASASSRLKWTQWSSCTIESHNVSTTSGLPETFISSNNIRRTLWCGVQNVQIGPLSFIYTTTPQFDKLKWSYRL